jgi:hypothetical protein
MGSVHPRVHVYLIRPPASAAALLGSELLVQKKWSAAKYAIGSSARAPFADAGNTEAPISVLDSVPVKTERLREILERWRRSEAFVGRVDAAEPLDTLAASVRAAHSGFVAALSVDDQPFLLSSISGRVSTDLDCQIAACLSCEGIELETDPENYLGAVNQIRAWFHYDRAAESAGVGGSRPRARKRLLSRIDAAIESSPPHVRISRSRDAARARSIATGKHSAALEAELDLLAHSSLPDGQLLAAVAALDSKTVEEHGSHPARLTIHSVLLLRETP